MSRGQTTSPEPAAENGASDLRHAFSIAITTSIPPGGHAVLPPHFQLFCNILYVASDPRAINLIAFRHNQRLTLLDLGEYSR
jgi:hypothetical protein